MSHSFMYPRPAFRRGRSAPLTGVPRWIVAVRITRPLPVDQDVASCEAANAAAAGAPISCDRCRALMPLVSKQSSHPSIAHTSRRISASAITPVPLATMWTTSSADVAFHDEGVEPNGVSPAQTPSQLLLTHDRCGAAPSESEHLRAASAPLHSMLLEKFSEGVQKESQLAATVTRNRLRQARQCPGALITDA